MTLSPSHSVRVFAGLAFVAISGHAQMPSALAAELPRERILYTTRRPASLQLYLVEAESPPKPITDDPALNYDATFSPDGRWVVFCSERSGNPHLYAIDLTHVGPPKQLTRGNFMDAAPAFTPDGRSLLFVSDRGGNADLFTMRFLPDDLAAGDEARNVTRNPAGDFRPAVSPDGKTVAFSSDRDSGKSGNIYPYRAEIYVMNLNGSDVRRLTRTDAMNGSPAWSRDGRTLFFYSDREDRRGERYRIWAMDSDGRNQRALTPRELSAFSPAVMPNGRVAFAVKQPDGFQVMSAAAEGSDVRLESGTQPDCQGPAFDRRRGQMVCSGRGPVSNALPAFAPGAHGEVRLPDRILDVQGVHSLFCSISPDGLEFVTGLSMRPDDPSDMRLVARRLDGSGDREVFLPAKAAPVWAMSWARRTDLIAFTVGSQFAREDAVVDIWTVHSDGSLPTNLTKGEFRNNAFPDLTADGKEIVFRSTRDGKKVIYLMKSDGTNARRVATDPAGGNATMPSISPKGDLIAFSTFKIYVQSLIDGKPDGSPRLFQEYSPSVHPRFSPDGKWIVFASRRAWLNDEAPLSNGESQPYGEIFVAPVEGKSEAIRLTHNKWEDSVPCWGVMPPSAAAPPGRE
jgi:Tol biopolymer transport system component